jgi:hypothetical protein
MVTVADLVRKLLDMPQGAPIALDGDCCKANKLDVEISHGAVCIRAYYEPMSNVTTLTQEG